MKIQKKYKISLIIFSLLLLVNTITLIAKFSGPICLENDYVYKPSNINEPSYIINFDNNSFIYYPENKRGVDGGFYIIKDNKIITSSNSSQMEFEIIDKFKIKSIYGERIYSSNSARGVFAYFIFMEVFWIVIIVVFVTILITDFVRKNKKKDIVNESENN